MTEDDLEMSNIVVSRDLVTTYKFGGGWQSTPQRLWNVVRWIRLCSMFQSFSPESYKQRQCPQRLKINKQVLSSINTTSHRTEQINKP